MNPKLLAVSAAFVLILGVAAGCTEKNRPNAAGNSATVQPAATIAPPSPATGVTGGTTATTVPAPAAAAQRPPTVTTTSRTSTAATNDSVGVVNQLRPSVVRVRTE